MFNAVYTFVLVLIAVLCNSHKEINNAVFIISRRNFVLVLIENILLKKILIIEIIIINSSEISVIILN